MLELRGIRTHADAKLPEKGFFLIDGKKVYDKAAGFDLYAPCDEDVVILPHGKYMFDTHNRLIFPKGYVGMIADRSNIGSKGIKYLAGCLDESYTGNVRVILANLNNIPVVFTNTTEAELNANEYDYYDLHKKKFINIRNNADSSKKEEYLTQLNAKNPNLLPLDKIVVRHLENGIAQMLLIEVPKAQPYTTEITEEEFELLASESKRGANGFGSTNVGAK